jgi:hypothetical protein
VNSKTYPQFPQAALENRTGFRRGPAYLAHQAREALGVADAHSLAEIPPPFVHTAFGAAVCAVAVLVRPETLGLRHSAMASTALAVLTAVLLVGYDRVVYPPRGRPKIDAIALPVAALAAFATVLAGVPQNFWIRLAAGVVAALVIGGVPQLVGRQAIGLSGWGSRLLRDVAGIAVLAPVLVAGSSPYLAALPRFGLVATVTLLVSFDGLRSEQLERWPALGIATAISLLVAVASFLGGTTPTGGGVKAGALLVLWYGLRGVGAAAPAGLRRRLGVLVEYSAFALLAAGALSYVALKA